MPSLHHEQVYSETFTMQANTTEHKSITLNQQDSYVTIVNTPSDYTILSAALSETDFMKWQRGQFNVSWDGNFYGGSMYGLSGNSKTYYAGLTEQQPSQNQTMVFWNPDSYSKQVNLLVYNESYEIDTAGLINANLLLAASTAGLVGIGLFFTVKNRKSIKFIKLSCKKALMLACCILTIILGSFLAQTYSIPVQAQTINNQGTVNVPANGYYPLCLVISQSGEYRVQFNVDKGTIQAFHSGDGTVIGHWSNGTEYDIRDEYYPNFNGSSGITAGSYSIESPYTTYYILSNTDNYSKNVTYQVTYNWIYNNYIAMIVGITLVIFGSIMFILTLLKGKLKDFDKALENQE